MIDADKMEPVEAFTECPYCDGMMVGGKCKDCGWMPEYEYSPELEV